MLKQGVIDTGRAAEDPAAFRRLCVETMLPVPPVTSGRSQPPSGGCVLKLDLLHLPQRHGHPAAFRRLCVETENKKAESEKNGSSRLQAAVC